MKKSLNVFFAISKPYFQHFAVAATSLLENNKDLDVKIFIIHDGLAINDFDELLQYFKHKYNTDIALVDVGNIDFSKFKTTGYYPKYTYFRLFLADLAPENIDSALFLDADLVVAGSIKELAEIDTAKHLISAVSEASVDDNVQRLNEIGFPAKSYFNAGVILVNLKAWREQKLSDQFIAIAGKYMDKLDWVDQDILNIYFANNWNRLDKKFNAVHLLRKLPVTPAIVHYASYSKPWYYVDTHPYNYLYWKYLRLTPFKNNKPTGFSLKNFIIKNGRLLKRQLRELGILKYKSHAQQ